MGKEENMSPYKSKLETCRKKHLDIKLDRVDAASVSGFVESVNDSGCTIKNSKGERAEMTFVALDHIRGITYEDWDFDNLDR